MAPFFTKRLFSEKVSGAEVHRGAGQRGGARARERRFVKCLVGESEIWVRSTIRPWIVSPSKILCIIRRERSTLSRASADCHRIFEGLTIQGRIVDLTLKSSRRRDKSGGDKVDAMWRRNLTLDVVWGGGVDGFAVAFGGAMEDSDRIDAQRSRWPADRSSRVE